MVKFNDQKQMEMKMAGILAGVGCMTALQVIKIVSALTTGLTPFDAISRVNGKNNYCLELQNVSGELEIVGNFQVKGNSCKLLKIKSSSAPGYFSWQCFDERLF